MSASTGCGARKRPSSLGLSSMHFPKSWLCAITRYMSCSLAHEISIHYHVYIHYSQWNVHEDVRVCLQPQFLSCLFILSKVSDGTVVLAMLFAPSLRENKYSEAPPNIGWMNASFKKLKDLCAFLFTSSLLVSSGIHIH